MTGPALARVIDFETTGLPEEPDSRICEFGYIDVDLIDPRYRVLPETGVKSLIFPGVPLRPENSAIHHIVEADVMGAPRIEEVSLLRGLAQTDVLVAHQAKFEQHFFPVATRPAPNEADLLTGEPPPTFPPQRWVDTFKVALRAWPDAPGHNVSTLRYWLDAQGLLPGFERDLAMPPHRAFPDAYATAHIFAAIMRLGRGIERAIEVSSMPGFLPKIRFGKHAGMKFSEIPTGYLEWMVKQEDMDPDAVFTAHYWLKKARAA